MKRRKLLVMLLAFALGFTQVGMPVYAATDLDDMPDLEFEEGVEDWNDCFLYGHTEVKDPAVAATCTAPGKTEGSHCSACDEVFTPQTEIPKLGHQVVIVPGREPTRTEAGWTEHSYCGRCGEVLVAKTDLPVVTVPENPAPDVPDTPDTPDEPSIPDVPSTPDKPSTPVHQHKLVKDPSVTATCTTDGKTEGLHCGTCSQVFLKQDIIPALGHAEVTDQAVAATFDADGLTEGKHCSRCDAKTVPQIVVPKAETAKLSYTKAVYTGKSIAAPKLIVKDRDGAVLTEGTDYTVTGLKARRKLGPYAVTVTLKGRYEGTKTLTFAIVPKAPKTVKTQLYGHDDVKVTWSKAKGATGYTVYYKKAGEKRYRYLIRTTKRTVKKKNLADGKKYVFKVVPYYKTGGKRYTAKYSKTSSIYTLKKVTGLKVSKSGAKVKVSWKDVKGETGYQISKSTKKSVKSLINKGKLTKNKYKKVTAAKGKTYYYKVRACKQVKINKKTVTIYGPWSTVKAYKLK